MSLTLVIPTMEKQALSDQPLIFQRFALIFDNQLGLRIRFARASLHDHN